MPRVLSLPDFKPVPPRLVVVANPGANMAAYSLGATNSHPLADLLSPHRASLLPQFRGGAGALQNFFRVVGPAERMEEISAQLREHSDVASAFLKPAPRPPIFEMVFPTTDPAASSTPDFTIRQGYLDSAPGGIDARFAWDYPGGGGDGIRIIDIEGAWQLTHEDLLSHQNGLAGGNPSDDIHWRNHGTAVLGVFNSDRNGFGVTGIAPEASVRMISVFGDHMDSASAIHLAADLLTPGDIILVELHQPGPRFKFEASSGEQGFIGIEWWPDDFAAIQYATSRGIVVVEAGGNGGENLDDPIYDKNPDPPYGPFPPSWQNPFRRGAADSGSILVGAGAPPPETHDRNLGPDRSRLSFSNYGSSVDVQGWGQGVTTCGYGDLQGGASEDLWYTDNFNGTSSAAPMIVGAIASLQGALRGSRRSQLAPAAVRELLRATGSPQQGTERIGNRPDLREILLKLIGPL